MGCSVYYGRRLYYPEDAVPEQEIYKRMEKEENQ